MTTIGEYVASQNGYVESHNFGLEMVCLQELGDGWIWASLRDNTAWAEEHGLVPIPDRDGHDEWLIEAPAIELIENTLRSKGFVPVSTEFWVEAMDYDETYKEWIDLNMHINPGTPLDEALDMVGRMELGWIQYTNSGDGRPNFWADLSEVRAKESDD